MEHSFSRYVMIGGNQMKFYCRNCEKIFDDTAMTDDEHCPHCGSEDFEDTFECEECGDVFPDSEKCYHENIDGPLCPECYHSENTKLSSREEYELSEFLRGWEEYKTA